jgi:hypothetical protein
MSKRTKPGTGSGSAPAAKRSGLRQLQRPITDCMGPQERCPLCRQSFSTLLLLIEHVEAAHEQQQEPEGGTPPPQAAAQEPEGGTQTQPQAPPPPPQQQQPVEWWKQRPADPVVAQIRFAPNIGSSTPPQQPVRLSALPHIAPVELVCDVFERGFSNNLLAQLLREAEQWVAGSWWFGGLQQAARHTSCVYALDAHQQEQAPREACRGSSASAPAQRDEGEVPQMQAGPLVQAAAATIADAVSARMAQPQRAHWAAQAAQLVAQLTGHAGPQQASGRPIVVEPAACTHAASHAKPPQAAAAGESQAAAPAPAPQLLWRPTYVLANHYRDAQSSVGSHSGTRGGGGGS